MKTVDVDPAMVNEIVEAAAWYEAQREGLGRRFEHDVGRTLEGLPSRPLRSLAGFKEHGARYVGLLGPWPYRVVVIERPTKLWAVALIHDRRQPGYWLSRLDR